MTTRLLTPSGWDSRAAFETHHYLKFGYRPQWDPDADEYCGDLAIARWNLWLGQRHYEATSETDITTH